MQDLQLDLRHKRHDRRSEVVQPRAVERRKGRDRRKHFARAGLLAAMAFAGGRIRPHAPVSDSETASASTSDSSTSDASVDVSTADFRMREYDKDDFDAMIKQASSIHGVDADLLRAVIQTESAFDPLAVSPVGALGMMQLMPKTAKSMGVNNPLDPQENILGGAKYLSGLLERFKGNMPLAVASYNAGARNVRRYGGIPPFRETQGYVKKIGRLLPETQGAIYAQQLVSTKVFKAKARGPQTRRARSTHSVRRTRA